MKKLGIGILSVFMILGGVLLSACEKKISLSVSTQEVVIYTNDEQEENFQSKEIDVSLENSTAGINVEILKGNDSVTVSSIKSKSTGKYSFTIFGEKSGEAEIRVSAIENLKENKIINVKVKTILEELRAMQDDNVDNRSNLYVVKNVEKELKADDYFDLYPSDTNISDIIWSFEDAQGKNSQEYIKDDILRAKIENGKLFVYGEYELSYINLRASFARNTNIYNNIRLEVLEQSIINKFTIDDVDIYQNNMQATDSVTFKLTRNNANVSYVEGSIVVNTPYSVDLGLEVYETLANGRKRKLSQAEYENYFIFDYALKPTNGAERRVTYTFRVDALDTKAKNIFGKFDVVFLVGYENYNYDISTEDVDIVFDTSYSATRIELFNATGDMINNSPVDVFSNYTSGNGFKITPDVLPTEVAIDNSMYFISVDINQEKLRNLNLDDENPIADFVKFYCRGEEIKFTNQIGSTVYTSTGLQNGVDIYVSSADKYDILEGVTFNFVSASNEQASTNLAMNFYKVSTDKNLVVTDEKDEDIDDVTYISSSMTSSRSRTFTVKIKDLTTISGLSLKTEGSEKFNYSNLQLVSSVDGDKDYVIVKFDVSLIGYNFSANSSFWLEHVTGKVSGKFGVEAFVPLQSASIKNADKSSADVYIDEQSTQNFVDISGIIGIDETKQNESISKLMLESGTSLPLNINYQNATLAEQGISYRILTFDNLVDAIANFEGLTEEGQALARANELFENTSLEVIANSYYRFFETGNTLYLSIVDGKLNLTDNAFKGYVCVLFNGYNELHEDVVLARFFAVESFYSVRYLSSSVTTKTLYTTETLSLTDINRSKVDVSITMRPDKKVPTYSNDLSYFTFNSAIDEFEKNETGNYLKNRYYEISDISFASDGRFLNFKITANSTNMQTSVRDVLTVVYLDQNGFKREAEIQIEIKNEKRIESVQWLNRTPDNEIYLNLTTTVSSERSFTISTSVAPSDANDIGLSYAYFATAGSASDLSITTSSIGQTFNLNINTSRGGYGSLYLLPNDMIKIKDGINQVLLYKYSVDEDGNVVETPIYKKLSELYLYYDKMITENDEISTYFYNNDGEKVYYKDLIIKINITIADGSSEGTAIRVYNQADLQEIDYAKYYKVMNNISLSEWKAYNQFSGMIFGKDDTVTIKFENSSENFVNNLSGTIKNIIFVGDAISHGASEAGFVADTNSGTIENVSIDVYYANGEYKGSSLLTYASSAGGIVGRNIGTIKNSFTYGMTINAVSSIYTGGIVGQNEGLVSGCGVEFYNFDQTDGAGASKIVTNIINAGGAVGGIVGFGHNKSTIEQSYAYAYSLTDPSNCSYGKIILNGGAAVGAFMANYNEGAKVVESFAFLGDLFVPVNSTDNVTMASFKNSYISYYKEGVINTRIYRDVEFAFLNSSYKYIGAENEDQLKDYNILKTTDIPTNYADVTTGSTNWQTMAGLLDSDVWAITDVETDTNFGLIHLKSVVQSAAVDLADVKIANNLEPLKSLNAGVDAVSGNEKGVLFVYTTKATISNTVEQSQLLSYNTISIADLFGVSSRQARSLLLTSDSKNISISSTTIRVLSKTVNKFTISVHSKMDFTKSKTFEFVILNNLPTLTTTIDGQEIKSNQTILLQTGLNNSRTIMFNLNNTIYLNGIQYATEKDTYAVEYALGEDASKGILNDEYISVSKSNNSLTLLGEQNHTDGAKTIVNAHVIVTDVAYDEEFADAVSNQRTRNFKVSVYNGATNLEIKNASSLEVKPSQYAVFDVALTTDAVNDNLSFVLNYGDVEIQSTNNTNSSAEFVVDSKLTLNFSWTRTKTSAGVDFSVLVKVAESSKHLLTDDYENLSIKVNATSQSANTDYVKTIALVVRTQNIEDISISTYNIDSRQIRNSVLYLTPANEITNTLIPSSDAIVAVTVSPAYAKMTHFTLTYSATSEGTVGTINIARLSRHTLYGYYVNSNSTSLIQNGIKVDLTDMDKLGDGVFYFRIYVSSSFQKSDLSLTLTYYNNDTILTSGSHNLTVAFMQEATIKVNDASTYVISKGSSATVTVTVNADQELADLYLQNNGSNISLSAYTLEDKGDYKVYTATITAYVDAELDGGKTSGIFYVCASVQRMINNIPEIKVSRATLCLVDFSIVGKDGVSVKSSGGTSVYNGKTYDVFYSYINSKDKLNFNYTITPETYEYDKNNASEVEAVERILGNRKVFETTNSYKDDETGYYINHVYNSNSGLYDPLPLKQQLWYCADESNATAIYNANYDTIIQHDVFSIEETQNTDGTSYLTITGKKTGRQLMKLTTTIIYQGLEFVYDYYFLVVVDIWSDEETPTQIFSGQEFVDFAKNSELAEDYILMNDIVLSEYTPLDTDKIKSLDGNGYTIHLNSFAMPEGNSLNLALFNKVAEDTTLKNIRVNIYNGGQIDVNISQYKSIDIAGFAITNNGVIYNCEVVSYYDEEYQISSISGDNGLVVKYMLANNTDPIEISSPMANAMGIESTVSGFVKENNASVINSRVGGESFRYITNIAGINYIKSQNLGDFVIEGQGEVAGFVNSNSSSGNISSCFADNVQIYNKMDATISLTAGFVLYNANYVQNSYVEGRGGALDDNERLSVHHNLTNISSIGIIAGFVYENSAVVKNSYANIAIENSKTIGAMVAGFVYLNQVGAKISLCYSACEISKIDMNQTLFSGVDADLNSLNYGTIEFSYYYNEIRGEKTAQNALTTGALSVTDIESVDTFYGFTFASGDDTYDGIWRLTENGITLVGANHIAFSNRYAVTNNNVTSIFYTKTIVDADTMETMEINYGSLYNPIIIRDAYDFAMSTGKASTTEISVYKEHYNDNEVFGNYRIVNNLDMSEIDQNAEGDGSVKLRTTTKTFSGLLDGNGFTISNINLGSSISAENYGLFAKLDGAVIMNLELIVDSIHNSQANIVGTLAGTAVDSRIMAISLSPVSGNDTDAGKTSILGNNVVGGVVGMLFGESRLSDISVSDIDIYSSYYSTGKSVGDNDEYVGHSLRDYINSDYSIYTSVREISYAGAVAGYVDIYDVVDSEYVKFSSSLEVGDYDIVTVHVADSVNIYGEVAGGLFGYVGDSTLVYDATIKLDADMALKNPSYIISKNLYAGGLIGESYGGLFAVSASYADELQKTIETSENRYYNGTLSAEKGQESIFSYTPQDVGYVSNTNEPLYVGGLVGYMGGGYIYIGNNKLNVISHSANTLAVGGIIGLAGYKDTLYDISFVEKSTQVNILLNDVYASGDVYVDGIKETEITGVSAGIIGALQRTTKNGDSVTSTVGMKNVLAVNYYSYNGAKLVGDDRASWTQGQDNYVSDNHFMLVGEIYDHDKQTTKVEKLDTNLYLIDSENACYDVYKNNARAGNGTVTVGGYEYVQISGTKLNINPFGFEITGNDVKEELLQVESVGNSSMGLMSAAYARMYGYFLPVGWENEYWSHTQDDLFPHIELTPKLNVVFWDYFNSQEVLRSMNNSGVTVVLRGRAENDDSCSDFKDIDLTNQNIELVWDAVSGFRGTLISYHDYMGTDDEGLVSITKSIDGVVVGGHAGDRVGIILDRSLFTDLDNGAKIEGVTFYNCNTAVDEDSSFSLVEKATGYATLRNIDIVINNDVSIKTKLENSSLTLGEVYTAGLITHAAYATSFINISVRIRNDANIAFVHDHKKLEDEDNKDVLMGILAGYIEQSATFYPISIEGIEVINETEGEEEDLSAGNITFNNPGDCKELYAGLYAGKIFKGSGKKAKLSIGLSSVGNVNLNIGDNSETKEMEKVFVGGFAGQIEGVDNVSLVSTKDKEGSVSGLTIRQCVDVTTLYAGLGFGNIKACANLVISNDGISEAKLAGNIYQVNGSSCQEAYVGGIAGYTNSKTEIQGFSVELNVGSVEAENAEGETFAAKTNEETSIYEKNLYDYREKLNPFIFAEKQFDGNTKQGVEELEQNSIGGFFGYVSGAKITITGNCQISGNIETQIGKDSTTENIATVDIGANNNNYLSIGGLIGQTTGSVVTTVVMNNTINISVEEDFASKNDVATAYVGGMIGKVVAEIDATASGVVNEILINSNAGEYSYATYTGNLLAKVGELKFGGAIGYIERTNYSTEKIDVSHVVYGGAVRIYGQVIETSTGGNKSYTYELPQDIVVGGIVGEFALEETSNLATREYSVSNSFSYGDVFVNYLQNDVNSSYNGAIDCYNVGGIVGSAAYINVKDCYSLLTSFNDRLAGELGKSYTSSIVGRNSSCVNYSRNYYSSGVTLSYQEENGNIDLGYGQTMPYSGYTNITGAEDTEADLTETLTSTRNILNDITKFVSRIDDFEVGHKLNPYKWTTNDINKQIDATDNQDRVDIEGNLHEMSWIALVDDLIGEYSISKVIAENLTNYAFVGNGHTITRIDTETRKDLVGENTIGYGGLVNELGRTIESQSGIVATPNFSIVSGLIMNLEVSSADLNNKENSYSRNYGGVAGLMYGHSIIYGVGVNGQLSVGGSKDPLYLAGIAGYMQSGMIAESYVDADITYRASEGGKLSGIANIVGNFNSLIKSTYSSGLLETYLDIEIYTFANSTNNSGTTSSDVIDCYSISQVKRNDVLENSPFDNVVCFGNLYDGIDSGLNIIECVINASYGVNADNGNTIEAETDISLAYDSNTKVKAQTLKAQNINEEDETDSSWYFNPYVNYGYASHGFGYLKNVTTYTREVIKEDQPDDDAIPESTKVYDDYQYTVVSYENIIRHGDVYGITPDQSYKEDWFLGVSNEGKFDQMIETVSEEEYTTPYKFVLRYDINFTSWTGYWKGVGNDYATNLIIDGNNKTLDFAKIENLSSGIFTTVIGDVENMRIVNANITASSQNVGILAGSFRGNITNVVVEGNIRANPYTGATSYVGGVIGSLIGNANAVDAVVNIENNRSGSVTGGVIGYLAGGSISYSSNAGQIVNNNSNKLTSNVSDPLKIEYITNLKKEHLNPQQSDIHSVSGGIVGYAGQSSEISYSYNANAVLDGYTIEASGNYVAGGIVGYAFETTITECYNIGLVGAGNYKNSGMSFAGGIVGYAFQSEESEHEMKVASCMNDGAVQAISKASTGYEINYTADENNKNVEAKTAPDSLNVDVTITYNKGSTRKIFAYGIGYVYNGEISGSTSTTSNIKNDGDIGEVSNTQTITFDRTKMLDNSKLKNGDFVFAGNFELDENIYINGYDSYGFPARVYMQDEMERYIHNDAVKIKDENVLKASDTWLDAEQFWYYKGIYNLDTQKISTFNAEQGGYWLYYANTITWVNEATKPNTVKEVHSKDKAAYNLSASTTYYQSASFVEYDNILNGTAKDEEGNVYLSLVGCDYQSNYFNNLENQNTPEKDVSISGEVENKVKKLNSAKENTEGFDAITIDGEDSAFVHNSSNFKTVMSPYQYTATVNLKQDYPDLFEKMESDSVLDKNIVIGTMKAQTDEGIVEVKPQFYTVDTDDFSENGILKFDLYFSQEVSGELSFDIKYRTIPESITLGKNNVFVYENGNTLVLLEDDKAQLMTDDWIIFTMNNGKQPAKDNYFELNSVYVGTTNITADVKFVYGDTTTDEELKAGGIEVASYQGPYMIYKGTEDLSGKTLEITYTETVMFDSRVSVELTSTHEINSFDTDNSDVTANRSFKNYEQHYVYEFIGSLDYDIFVEYVQEGTTVGYQISIAELLSQFGTTSNFSMGNENYSIWYNSGALNAVDKNVSDGILVDVDGESLIFVKSIQLGATEQVVTNSTDEELREVRDFIDYKFVGTRVEPGFEVYKELAEIISDNEVETSYICEEKSQTYISYKKIATVKDKGNFGSDGKYHGSNFAGENGANEVTKYGITYYEIDVTYDYEEMYEFSSNKGFGYTSSFKTSENGQITKKRQGYLSSTNKLTLSQADMKDIQYVVFDIVETQTVDDIEFDGYILSKSTENQDGTGGDVYSLESNFFVAYNDGASDFLVAHNIQKGKDYISTIGTFSDAGTLYTYRYTIYDDGTIEVIYLFAGTDGNTSDQDMKDSRRFVAAPNGTLSEYTYNADKTWTYKGSASWNNFESFDAATYWGDLTNKITVLMIATHLDVKEEDGGYYASELYFAKFTNITKADKEFRDVDVFAENESKTETTEGISLYANNTTEFMLTPGEASDGTFEVSIDDGTTWTKDSDNKIEASTYETKTFEYRYKTISSFVTSDFESPEQDEVTVFENVILKDDVYLDSGLDENDKTIVGNEYTIRFVAQNSSSISLFEKNTKDIKNLIVIGMASLFESNQENYALFVKENSADLSGIDVYGSVRNIDSSREYGVSSAIAQSAPTATLASINSYVTMVGLDAERNEDVVAKTDVKVVLKDLIAIVGEGSTSVVDDESEFESHNIILAGNALKAANGKDGEEKKDNQEKNAFVGQSGGQGGSVMIEKSTFKGIVRVGTGGYAGYGGNGAHGTYMAYYAIGGGAGGAAGENGTNGTLIDESNIIFAETENITSLGVRAIGDTQLGGNGGIGGLGRITESNIEGYYLYYTSGGGGAANVDIERDANKNIIGNGRANNSGAGGNGANKGYWNGGVDTSQGQAYGAVRFNTFVKKAGDLVSDFVGSIGTWKDNVNEKVKECFKKSIFTPETGGEAGIRTLTSDDVNYNGGQVKISKVYIDMQTANRLWWYILWHFETLISYKQVWTSGETINSAGSFGNAGIIYAQQ